MASWNGASILVIRLSSLGDVARLLPALSALKSAAGGVDITVEDRFAALLDLFPIADRVVPYPRRHPGSPWRSPAAWARAMSGYRGRLTEARYDLALDLHGILRSALVARLSGARQTAGFARGFGKEGSHLLYGLKLVPAPEVRISRYARYAGAIAALGFPSPPESYLSPRVPEEARADVARFLGDQGLAGRPFLFAFLGTSRAQGHKRWPAFRFVELARLARQRLNLPTVLGWGPEEADLVTGLREEEGLLPIPDWDLPRLVEVIRSSAAFVGADTGAMHLAALMGAPTVAVLGPTDPVLNAPFGRRARVVHRAGLRRACSGEGCAHRDCMAAIGSEEVAGTLGELLDGVRAT